MLGKIEDRRRGCQRIRWLDVITDAVDMHLGKLREMVRDREAWHAAVMGLQRVGHDWATKQQHGWAARIPTFRISTPSSSGALPFPSQTLEGLPTLNLLI